MAIKEDGIESALTGQFPTLETPRWLSITDVGQLLADHGFPRNHRTIRRYCARGDLLCQKTENALHQPQYFVDAASVQTYIDQQRTLLTAIGHLTGVDRTEPDMSTDARAEGEEEHHAKPDAETSGSVRFGPDVPVSGAASFSDQVVEQLHARLADKDEEIRFLRSELQHRRTTDSALHDVIAAFRANAEAQRLSSASYANAPDMPGQAQADPGQGGGTAFN